MYLIISLILILLLSILFNNTNTRPYFINVPYATKSIDFVTLQKVNLERVQEIKDSLNILSPYNKNAMSIMENNLKNAKNLKTLVGAYLLTPYNSVNLVPNNPLVNPLDTTCFQYEQGVLGWYWGYLTFTKNTPNSLPISLMYYIIRIDLSSPQVRQKYKLGLGETAVYNISFGIGEGTNWTYSPFQIVNGSYEVQTESSFIFNSLDEQLKCNFISYGPGQLYIKCNWTAPDSGNTYGFETNMYSKIKPYLNQPEGCAPCLGGAGTAYWAYTQLFNYNTTYTINGNTQKLEDDTGVGWMDRQWGGNFTRSNIILYITGIQQLFTRTGSLGKYIWLNIHMDTYQYMIWCFLPVTYTPVVGEIIKNAFYTMYSIELEDPIYTKPVSFKILSIKYVYDALYITKFELTLPDPNGDDHVYILDTTPFGNTVTFDLSGNYHWSGSSILSQDGILTGSSFVEMNEFQTIEVYVKNIFSKCELVGNTEPFTTEKVLSFVQVLPLIIILLLVIILTIIWIVQTCNYVVKFVKDPFVNDKISRRNNYIIEY